MAMAALRSMRTLTICAAATAGLYLASPALACEPGQCATGTAEAKPLKLKNHMRKPVASSATRTVKRADGEYRKVGLKRRPKATPPPEAQATVTPAAAQAFASYEVARGDTLYGIARGIAGDDRTSIQRTMIALFRANSAAFNGNINQLRAGAILRVPSSEEIAGISSAEAASEVSQQNSAWRAAGGGQDAGRLKLVTPPEGPEESAAAPESSGRVESQIDALEHDITEQKRLLELQNQELADLQRKLAEARAEGPYRRAFPL